MDFTFDRIKVFNKRLSELIVKEASVLTDLSGKNATINQVLIFLL